MRDSTQFDWVMTGLYYKDFPVSFREKALKNLDMLRKITPLIIDSCSNFSDFAARAKGEYK